MAVRVRVNLLPHRQAARRRRERSLLSLLAGGALMGLLLMLGAGVWLQTRLDACTERQDGWRSALRQVDGLLAEGREVQGEMAVLAARQHAIAGLQAQRNAWVAMFGTLARAMPAGVVLRSVRQEAATVRLQGLAISQDRVAALLQALAQAAPMSAPQLLEVRQGLPEARAGAVEWTIQLTLASPA